MDFGNGVAITGTVGDGFSKVFEMLGRYGGRGRSVEGKGDQFFIGCQVAWADLKSVVQDEVRVGNQIPIGFQGYVWEEHFVFCMCTK